MLKNAITRKNAKKEDYKKLSRNLGFKDIKELTNLAVREGNIDALMALAQSNIYAVTAELSKPEYNQFFAEKYAEQKDSFIPQLYFMIRSHAPPQMKRMLARLTRMIILRKTYDISGKGSKGKTRIRIPYRPGLAEFDLEQTLFNYIQRGQVLSFDDIVGIDRKQKKRNVVLIMDTSGSMFGELLLNAALTASVLSYAMERDNVGVILFAGDAYVLKPITEQRVIHQLIDEILDSEAVGFTDISKALRKGLDELKKARRKNSAKSLGILITDGDYNRGENPVNIARLFPELHVINMPPDENGSKNSKKLERSRRVCQEIARAGHGYYYPVSKYEEIPRALMSLMTKL